MSIFQFYHKFIFHIAIFSIPFFSFINTNFRELDFVLVQTTLLIFIVVTLFTFIFSRFLSIFLKKLNYKEISFVISVIFFLLFFLYPFFKEIIHYINPVYKGEISFLLSIIFFIFFYFIFYQKKINSLIKFFLIYLGLCFLFNLSVFLINATKVFYQNIPSPHELFTDQEIKNIKNNDKKNIYFVIIDSALPINKFDLMFQTNFYQKNKNEFNSLGYTFIENSKSSYQQTKYTLASILYYSYYLNMDNYKSVPSSTLYPMILSRKNSYNVPLIKTLNKIGYEFKWIGGYNRNCKLYNINYCLNNYPKKENSKIISYYTLHTFLKRSPIVPIYSRINSVFSKSNSNLFDIKKMHYENDAIGKFLEKIEAYNFNNKPQFFLIHNLAPHKPYIYNSDCTFQKNRPSWLGYKKNYECALKRVKELIDYIDINDPNAIVIIQSDHSIRHDAYPIPIYNSTPLFTRYDIFNLIKINNECKKYLSNEIDQVNAVRLSLFCATGQKAKLVDKKMYFADFEVGNASVGGSFILKEIKTFEDELSVIERY